MPHFHLLLRRNTIIILVLVTIIFLLIFRFSGTTINSANVQQNMLKRSVSIPMPGIRRRGDTSTYSRFRCVGDDNDHKSWQTRCCNYMNICYDVDQREYNYYQRSKRIIQFDRTLGHLYNFTAGNHGHVTIKVHFPLGFAPNILYEAVPKDNVHRLHKQHVLYSDWAPDYNFGHHVFEEIGGIMYSLLRLNVYDPNNTVIMHIGKLKAGHDRVFPIIDKTRIGGGLPDHPLYQKWVKGFMSAIASHPLVYAHDYLSSFNKRYVCFDNLQAGGTTGLFKPKDIAWNSGKEPLFAAFRDAVMRRHGIDPRHVPSAHRIVISNKPSTARSRTPKNFQEMVTFIKATYGPYMPVEVIDWSTLTVTDQIRKISDTTIFITVSGGISMVMPFLPEGAHAIIFDYPENRDRYGFKKGDSASMEGAFWGHWAHFKKQYYQLREKYIDYEVPNGKDARDSASPIVDMQRIRDLIDSALEDMDVPYA